MDRHPVQGPVRLPGTATPGNPPKLCGGIESNGEVANDEDLYTATLGVPTGGGNQQNGGRKTK